MPDMSRPYGDEELHAKWALLVYIVQATPDQTPHWYLRRYNAIATGLKLPEETPRFAVSACKSLKERGMFSVAYNCDDRPVYHMRKVRQYQPELAELFNIVTPKMDVIREFAGWVKRNGDMFGG